MLPLDAVEVLVVEGINEDPLTRARAERLLTGIRAPEVREVDDEELNAVIGRIHENSGLHGMDADIQPVVIFNRFRFDDDEVERQRRFDAYPAIRDSKLNGYGGFDWRESGSARRRATTGVVCQPAWHIHTIVGCHFRCAYCGLGHFVNILLNIEDYVSHLDGFLERCPQQRLFQWDNYTDVACFEPEYGAAAQFVDYFATRPGQALELYVGKSDNVDFLLDLDHRGHTVCCWSLAGSTQSTAFEKVSAPTEARIEAMRRCQEAGYPIRVRLSPIIPVKNWREENEDMLAKLFAAVKPDVVTAETIRFLDYTAMAESFDLSLLDEDFVASMKGVAGDKRPHNFEVPHDFRKAVYDVIIGQIERLSPSTPYAFCRESPRMWGEYKDGFAQHGQHTGKYFCNCGPHCAPATALAR